MDLVLVDVAYDSELAAGLIDEIQADLTVRYGGPDETPVDPAQFAPPDGAFVVALRDGDPVACAALRRHGETEVELKRMFVRRSQRRTGVARTLLARLEERARAMGYERLVLETGTAQPEAIALYESAGYQPVPAFGFYADAPESRSYGKVL